MTRNEALEILAKVVREHGGYVSELSIEMSLDGYVALGMLKLDSPPDEPDEAD